jgi:deazaflavin-dependent oxidoreductase (nitroreductase family)
MSTYDDAGLFRKMVRRTAATRPVSWLYARIQPPTDSFIYRRTNGRATLSSWMSDLPIVMLTTTGAKSGRSRTTPVLALAEGDALVVIASNYGRPYHPAWYHNLRANPRASVAVDGTTREVEARQLSGEERERYFRRGAELYPGCNHYVKWAGERRIGVFRLEPPSPPG